MDHEKNLTDQYEMINLKYLIKHRISIKITFSTIHNFAPVIT